MDRRAYKTTVISFGYSGSTEFWQKTPKKITNDTFSIVTLRGKELLDINMMMTPSTFDKDDDIKVLKNFNKLTNKYFQLRPSKKNVLVLRQWIS